MFEYDVGYTNENIQNMVRGWIESLDMPPDKEYAWTDKGPVVVGTTPAFQSKLDAMAIEMDNIKPLDGLSIQVFFYDDIVYFCQKKGLWYRQN